MSAPSGTLHHHVNIERNRLSRLHSILIPTGEVDAGLCVCVCACRMWSIVQRCVRTAVGLVEVCARVCICASAWRMPCAEHYLHTHRAERGRGALSRYNLKYFRNVATWTRREIFPISCGQSDRNARIFVCSCVAILIGEIISFPQQIMSTNRRPHTKRKREANSFIAVVWVRYNVNQTAGHHRPNSRFTYHAASMEKK